MQQSTLFSEPDGDDDLVIIGVPRDATGTQSHSTFRKIDMAAKQGKLLSFEWGDLMVMLPRPLYDRVFAFAAGPGHDSRAAAIARILIEGLKACSE